jgi:hypothetical protein
MCSWQWMYRDASCSVRHLHYSTSRFPCGTRTTAHVCFCHNRLLIGELPSSFSKMGIKTWINIIIVDLICTNLLPRYFSPHIYLLFLKHLMQREELSRPTLNKSFPPFSNQGFWLLAQTSIYISLHDYTNYSREEWNARGYSTFYLNYFPSPKSFN